MLEAGHLVAFTVRKRPFTVRLVLSNKDLVKYYENLFAEKQDLAEANINFEWLSMAAFRANLAEDPG